MKALLACLLCLLLGTGAQAQGVYKCSAEGGKTVYQAVPCAGGKAVDIPAGPTAEQVKQTRARVDAEKARVAAIVAAEKAQAEAQARAAQAPAGGLPGKWLPGGQAQGKADCAKLNQERERAYGQRIAAVRESQRDNRDRSNQVSASQDRIQRTEAAMGRAGCPLQ